MNGESCGVSVWLHVAANISVSNGKSYLAVLRINLQYFRTLPTDLNHFTIVTYYLYFNEPMASLNCSEP